jgi:hypothetical protein
MQTARGAQTFLVLSLFLPPSPYLAGMRHYLRRPDPREPSGHPAQPPPMDHSRGGHSDCQYSDAMARVILARLDGGETVKSVTSDPAMPSHRTLYDWLERIPQFAEAWEEMRAEQAAARRRRVEQAEPDRAERERLRAASEGRRPRAKAGRKSSYTPERADAVCEFLLAGHTLRECAAQPGMPSITAIYGWLRNHPEFRRDYMLTLMMREHLLIDRARDLVNLASPSTAKRLRGPIADLYGRMGALRPDVWRWWD